LSVAAEPSPGLGALRSRELDRLCVDTIRLLSADAVQRARCGHPGLPMAMAPVAYTLFTRVMQHDPSDPSWPDRDRFVLSAGHGSMLLYSSLHLCGYGVSLDDLKEFRQWGSITPGHPERGRTPGVETTTGPLGQGFANGVGMAMAERFLRERYGAEVCDHRVFAICSDGDLMEGVSAEAASLAGHLGLGRLVYVYDDNRITIDGSTSLSFTGEDVEARFRAYGWHTSAVEDANDLKALERAIAAAVDEPERPSLIRVRSVIGYGSPAKAGTPGAHGAALGEDELRATKIALGWNPDLSFEVPAAVRTAFSAVRANGERARVEWEQRFAQFSDANPEQAAEWRRAWSGELEPGIEAVVPTLEVSDRTAISTRQAGRDAMAALAEFAPTMVGGSADLVASTLTTLPGRASFTRASAGANVHWGVREHAMGGCVNGLALHGGIVGPYGSTFLVFSDYMRASIRLSALMGLPVIWVFTHDSVAVGEDGPTHQPVEHYAALRAIPGLTVIRPADANETAQAWLIALEHSDGPVCLLLTRQDLPVLGPGAVNGGVAHGGYVLRAESDSSAPPDVVLIASGSEVSVALAAADALAQDAIAARVVSMPSLELFAAEEQDYRDGVLPAGVPTVAVEAGVAQGWAGLADGVVSIERFGASAPAARVMAEMGITPERVAAQARETISRRLRAVS
jgi:transketolase